LNFQGFSLDPSAAMKLTFDRVKFYLGELDFRLSGLIAYVKRGLHLFEANVFHTLKGIFENYFFQFQLPELIFLKFYRTSTQIYFLQIPGSGMRR
jgi:hypothetical protein